MNGPASAVPPMVSRLDMSPQSTDPSPATPNDGYDPMQIIAMAQNPPPGASVYSPTMPPSAAVNPRSCVTCRRRKVRCDKHMPCSNCRRAMMPCIFPPPGRAPRRSRPKDPNAPHKQPSSEREMELVQRLRKLEGIVRELSGQIEVESSHRPSTSGNSPNSPEALGFKDRSALGGPNQGGASGSRGGSVGIHSPAVSGSRPPRAESEPGSHGPGSPEVHKQFGRLVLTDHGTARYVSSSLWSSINDELDELRKASQNLTSEESEESDVEGSPQSPDTARGTDYPAFIFGYRSASVDLRPLHPLPSQIPFIWQVYQENVDPVLKVVHVPSMTHNIKRLIHNLDDLTPSMEALMFAIYYAAITSLDEEEVKLNFNAEKADLVQKYRFAIEQALAKAEILTNPNFTVAQAFLLFLVLVRRHDDTRFAWTLTGLLIRISQSLGLHRDGTNFPNLSPFQVEMRRRLFWALCVLDLRSAEDQGTDLTIAPGTFDTRIPLNINDTDIAPESTALPEPREGTTDMAFSLVRYEICALSRRLYTLSSATTPHLPCDADKSLEEREEMLLEVSQRVQERLLKDNNNSMFWVASNVARVVAAKMTLVIYQSVLFPGPGNDQLSEDVRARLLNAALDVFEYSHQLNTDPRFKQWRWLFQTWSHWNALGYALVEVSQRPWGPKAERIWAALNLTFQSPNSAELEKLASHHAVWMPLRKLYLKVKKHREAEIARLKADPDAARALDELDQYGTPPSAFGSLDGARKAAHAAERWRNLVGLPPRPSPPPPPPPPAAAQQPPQQPPSSQVARPQAMVPGMPPLAPSLGSGPQALAFASPAVLQQLDEAMSQPSFVPTDFMPVWNAANPDASGVFDLAALDGRPGLAFGPGTPGLSDLQVVGGDGLPASMGPATSLTSTPVSVAGSGPRSAPAQGAFAAGQPVDMQQTPAPGATAGVEEALPPWLWTPNGGSPDILNLPSQFGLDEMDVNMDEGFDWQSWQERLGRYEVSGGGWGPGL
ncbi:hypothetical protein VTJ83DRAFT_147 [Remersonia thermophila]|uniref:Zn(2)-C6 fungal-type domain-containing protein n=1 Tax=Remersonia thermophila TaxID=72144 RepID=A0ABR4DKJ3_9PEZI